MGVRDPVLEVSTGAPTADWGGGVTLLKASFPPPHYSSTSSHPSPIKPDVGRRFAQCRRPIGGLPAIPFKDCFKEPSSQYDGNL